VANNETKASSDCKATSRRFGRLTEIPTFRRQGILVFPFHIKTFPFQIRMLKPVANWTQYSALNSPGIIAEASIFWTSR